MAEESECRMPELHRKQRTHVMRPGRASMQMTGSPNDTIAKSDAIRDSTDFELTTSGFDSHRDRVPTFTIPAKHGRHGRTGPRSPSTVSWEAHSIHRISLNGTRLAVVCGQLSAPAHQIRDFRVTGGSKDVFLREVINGS